MHRVVRFGWAVRQARRRPVSSPWDTTRTSFRVRLRQLDVLRHMTNSAYLDVLDLARVDLVVRSGSWDQQRKNKIYAVVSDQTVTYKKSLKWRDKYDVETRVAGVDEKAIYFEHKVVRQGKLCAQALVRTRFLRVGGGTVPAQEIVAMSRETIPADLVLEPWMKEWAANVTLSSSSGAANMRAEKG